MTQPHILIAHDLSPLADRALERGFQLASSLSLPVTVLHVIEAEEQDVLAEKRIEAQLDAVIAQAVERTGVQGTVTVLTGNPVEIIPEYARQGGAPLIVLGLHKPQGLADWFGGSTAEGIIRKSDIPVLTVQDRALGAYRNVLAAVDFSPSSEKAIRAALPITPEGNWHAFHAYEDTLPAMAGLSDRMPSVTDNATDVDARVTAERKLADFLKTIGGQAATAHPLLERGNPKPRLNEVVARLQPDLIVVGTHGRAGILTTFIGGVASDLLRHPPADILVAKV